MRRLEMKLSNGAPSARLLARVTYLKRTTEELQLKVKTIGTGTAPPPPTASLTLSNPYLVFLCLAVLSTTRCYVPKMTPIVTTVNILQLSFTRKDEIVVRP